MAKLSVSPFSNKAICLIKLLKQRIIYLLSSLIFPPALLSCSQDEFCLAHCDKFFNDDENRLEYTPLFEHYAALIENFIGEKLAERVTIDCTRRLLLLPPVDQGMSKWSWPDSANASSTSSWSAAARIGASTSWLTTATPCIASSY